MAGGPKRDLQLDLELDGGAEAGDERQRTAGAGGPRRARTTFLVGRVTPGAGEIILGDFPSPPFPGPWTLRALIRPPPILFGPTSNVIH
jgi:hypothetical protein